MIEIVKEEIRDGHMGLKNGKITYNINNNNNTHNTHKLFILKIKLEIKISI